jgi:hypothetical protein
VEEEANVASMETKILGKVRLQRGEEKILKGGRLSKLAKMCQSINGYSKERDNTYLYQQIVGRKYLERESEIRRIL